MSSFAQVIPVVGTPNGFLGEPSRTGGGDPMIISAQANASNAANINFGDTVVLLPDTTGGTCKQFADWQTNGGGLAVATATTNASATITPTSLAGISLGMFVFGAGIPAGTYISAISPSAGTATLSKNATATAGAAALTYAVFAGIAVREVKSQLGYPYTPGATQVGQYLPGQQVGILVRGTITVKVTVGAPVRTGPAYLRAIVNGGIPAGLLGDLEANPDGNNNILLAGIPTIADANFKTGNLDSNNLTELTFLSRVAA